ncbi:MAG: TIGR03084 family metal-binding protein [Sciscionella sp.]
MAEIDTVLGDLDAEGNYLDGLVAALPAAKWATATPAVGWTVAHQIGHLAWTDEATVLAATDEAAFAGRLAALLDGADSVDAAAEQGAREAPAELLARWRAGRGRVVEALRTVPEGSKLPWFGPPMRATSMATARLMETWAHGRDVADALGVRQVPTPRLRHVAHLGVRTRDFAFGVHGEEPPEQAFRIELTGPGDERWTWGPDAAAQRVEGPAEDFCLLVTQRRHRDDLALLALGADAEHWLDIGQAFAGPPGTGRRAGATR